MNKSLTIVLLLIAVTFMGCATASVMNRIGLGMTKTEVISAMGTPNSTKASDNQEILEYMLYDNVEESIIGYDNQYWVVLINGRVTQYGRAGDFGNSSPFRQQVDININQPAGGNR